jgi:hypothetical protein
MSFTIPLTNGAAAFTPGGSYSLIFTAKRSSKDPDTAAVFQKSTATGTITTSTTNAIVTVLYTDTTNEDEPVLYWDIQAQHNSTAAVITAAKGTLTLVRDITRQTTASVPIYTVDPAAGNAATPAGSTGWVQINNAGVLGADSGLVYTGTGDSGKLTVGGGRIYMDATTGAIQANNIAIGGSNGVMPFANVTPAAGNVGSLNVSIGSGNFQAITTGNRNVACGAYSLYSLTTGASNLGIGNNTLTNLTTGQRNTALGSGAGGPSTGNDNIFINSATDVYTTSNCQIAIAGTSDGPSSTVIGFDGRGNEVPTTKTRFIGNTIIWGDGVVGGSSPTASPNNRTSLVQTSSGTAKTITLPNVTGKLPVYTDTPAEGQVLTATDASGAATWENASGGNLTSGPVTSSSGVSAIADGALTIAKTNGLQTALDLKTNNSVGFMEDFTNSTRWAEGAVITNNTTTPQVTATGDPYFLLVAGTASPAPNVQNRGYGAGANNQLWYLGSSVPTSGGKMSLGFKFEHRKNPTTISNFNNTFNISFNANVMQTPSTGGIIPGDGSDAGVVHINFDRSGISSCGIYLQADFTCLSHTKVSGLYSFTKQTQGNLPLDRDFVVLIKVDGNYMTITIPTLGSFLFFSTKLPSKIGAAKTYFWFEDLKNDDYSSWGFLKKIWGGNNSILDTDPDWGGFIGGNLTSLNTGTFHVLPGTVISNAANPSTLTGNIGLLMADGIPSVGYGFKAAAVSATSNLANGGNVFIEGAYLSNVGTTAVGGNILGRSPMNIASAITTTLSSTTGTNALLKSFVRIPTLANSDSQSIEIYGQLVGVLAKRINIILDSAVGTLFDSDLTVTPLNLISGAYRIVIKRFSLSGAGSIFYTVMTLPDGTNLPMSRLSTNMITEAINIRFQTTTAAAGGVTIDGAIQTVEKVINR